MNKKTIEITEDDLHAYVDNQLSADKVVAVEALIRNDTNIAQQINDWKQQNKVLSEHFSKESITETPKQLDLKKLSKKANAQKDVQGINQRKTPWSYSMAASLMLLVTGGAIGWFAHDVSQTTPRAMTSNTANFVNSAISAHQVYTVEVLHPVEINADKEDQMVSWLSKRINHPLTVPNLQNYGYELLGGRLLSMQEGRSAAQLMFENDAGKRVTLLVSKNPIYRDQAFHLKNNDSLNAYYWMDSNVAYSITGEMNSKALRKLSKSVYEQLSKKLIGEPRIASTQF